MANPISLKRLVPPFFSGSQSQSLAASKLKHNVSTAFEMGILWNLIANRIQTAILLLGP